VAFPVYMPLVGATRGMAAVQAMATARKAAMPEKRVTAVRSATTAQT
jgi:hypothetical protein